MIGWGVNRCIYIRNVSEYSYKSIDRRQLKEKYGLIGKVEDHHIIPREFREHPVIIGTGYSIDGNENLKMMPNMRYDVPEYILRHHSHLEYNKYVGRYLDMLRMYEDDSQYNRLVLFRRGLDERLNYKNTIPWD